MRGFPQEARREISLGVDGPQQVDCVHPTFDKIGDRFAILGRDLLAADHEVEDRIVDEGARAPSETCRVRRRV